MREMLNKYGFLITCLFVSFGAVADEHDPPSPLDPVPPPGLPIDDGLLALLGFGLLFGFYKIYISILKKKRSM